MLEGSYRIVFIKFITIPQYIVAPENSEGKTCLSMKDGISPLLVYVACLKLMRIKRSKKHYVIKCQEGH